MNIAEVGGKIRIVLGLIAPEELGITLPHEHLLCDGTTRFLKPTEATAKVMAHHPVTPDILAMSALLTVTTAEQRKVINNLKEKNIRGRVKVMVGGGQ